MEPSEQALVVVLDHLNSSSLVWSGRSSKSSMLGHRDDALLASLEDEAATARLAAIIACVSTSLRTTADDRMPLFVRFAAGRKLCIAQEAAREWSQYSLIDLDHQLEAGEPRVQLLPLPYDVYVAGPLVLVDLTGQQTLLISNAFHPHFFGRGTGLSSEIEARLRWDEQRWWAGKRGGPKSWAWTHDERRHFFYAGKPSPPSLYESAKAAAATFCRWYGFAIILQMLV